jgi:2-hydroxychromene-2-carboxylate isomerase
MIRNMARVTWYFDFVSPYAYLALHTLNRLPAGVDLKYQPVLLAGLLDHWGQKGPAEIAPKRVWTYRECIWRAMRDDVPFRMPAAHPFNPLPYLRLSIAAGNSVAAVTAIFETLWTTGASPADESLISSLTESLGVDPKSLADAGIKRSLRESTEQAAERGVFGVPSFVIDGQVFWGGGSLDFAAAYLMNPAILAAKEMIRADTLPVGASRRGSS